MAGGDTTRRVLGCFPHPDDEIFAAGLLAWCADRGAEVHLLTATRGEAGTDRRGLLPSGQSSRRGAAASWRDRARPWASRRRRSPSCPTAASAMPTRRRQSRWSPSISRG
jgi:hypothetical protein